MRGPDGRYPPIEAHGIIGDLQTVALVGLDGCVDFLCLPHFDSPSVFAKLLDADKGGHFSITPALERPSHKQLYLPNTNMLLTRFLAAEGVVEISDFMPIHPQEHTSRLIRRVKTVRGEITYQARCAPRFDYARAKHAVAQAPQGVEFTGADGTVLRLSSTVPLEAEGPDGVATFTLRAGETATFVLEQVTDRTEYPTDLDQYVSSSFKTTMNFWRELDRPQHLHGEMAR